jgi:hypothetical protein
MIRSRLIGSLVFVEQAVGRGREDPRFKKREVEQARTSTAVHRPAGIRWIHRSTSSEVFWS